ncbi:MAG: translation initiation factor IF-2 [Candidatus Dojkabacteria bacterium]
MAKKKSTKKKVQKKKEFSIGRTPIVAVMGHVDHGKTSLLDAIRGTSVQESEAGGITQNTRAHQIEYNGQKISFIDTPGHEAFSDMRSRGAKVTDMVLLVVAADDGVQPQTKESIKFAQASNVPVVVAINKIDKPGKKLAKLKQELASAGLELEEFGGDTLVNEVSAIEKKGLSELLESILLVAELEEIKPETAPAGRLSTAFVLEASLDKNLGPVALMLVKSGRFTEGNYVVHATGYAKVRALLDENQEKLDEAQQSDPVYVIGLKEVLATGEIVNIVENEKQAKALLKEVLQGEAELLEEQPEKQEESEDLEQPTEEQDLEMLSQLLSAAQSEKEIKYLNLVLKTGSQGTLEVIKKELGELDDNEVKIKLISEGIGPITEKDVTAAKAAHGIVIGFQVEIPKKLQKLSLKEKVLVRNYEVIYELIDEMSDALDSMSDPVIEKVEVARAKVKKVFVLTDGNAVAGCEVAKGTVIKGYKAFVERDEVEMAVGKITSLKQNKNEVKEVKKGQDCGILLEPNYKELEEGDFIVLFKEEKI